MNCKEKYKSHCNLDLFIAPLRNYKSTAVGTRQFYWFYLCHFVERRKTSH